MQWKQRIRRNKPGQEGQMRASFYLHKTRFFWLGVLHDPSCLNQTYCCIFKNLTQIS